jgi:hypothetical protein
MENITQIIFLAVLVAVIANQVLGALWYSPILFGNTWIRELNIDADSISKKDATKSMIRAFLYSIINLLLLAYFIQVVQTDCTAKGLMVGFLLGLFAIVQMGINATFESKTLKLFIINASYPLISYSICGIIIGAW